MTGAVTTAQSLSANAFIFSDGYDTVLSAGRYTVRFARTRAELAMAQQLRYEVLYRESGGRPSAQMQERQREEDHWDAFGLHVIVSDSQLAGSGLPAVVGTVRLIPKNLLSSQPLYTEMAFDLQRVFRRFSNALEISRFCIHPSGRQGSILRLIWKFALQYIYVRSFDVLIGCASFKGADISRHRDILSYLYDHHLADVTTQPLARSDRAIRISDIYRPQSEWKEAQQSIPTLMRGYLKVGAKISDRAIIDPVFNTVFVCIYADTEDLTKSQQPLAASTRKPVKPPVRTPQHTLECA